MLRGSSIDLAPETGGSNEAGVLEVLGSKRRNEAAEENITTASLGKTSPGEEEQLSGVPEGNPVGHTEDGLKNAEEAEEHPVGNPLGVIGFANGKESMHGVVTGDNESSKVSERLASKVEDDEKEVKNSDAADNIGLGSTGLLLKVHQDGVLAELLIELRDVVVGSVLERHLECSLIGDYLGTMLKE